MDLATIRRQAAIEVSYKSEPWREAIKAEVRDLLRLFSNVCTQHNIPYFIANGTLLGALKFQGQIPWDDDADVGVFGEDIPRLIPILQSSLITTPYHLLPTPYGYLIHGPAKGMLDLLVFMRDPSSTVPVYRMAYPLAKGKPTFWMASARFYEFPETELFPLRDYLFENFTLQGPADGRPVCMRAYGSNVFTVNRRPDRGYGIHPYWPFIVKVLNPLSQGCTDWLAQYCPRLAEQLASVRHKKRGVSVTLNATS